jgi:hypothetical protein
MLEHTKKPSIELRFIGPPENREKPLMYCKNLALLMSLS